MARVCARVHACVCVYVCVCASKVNLFCTSGTVPGRNALRGAAGVGVDPSCHFDLHIIRPLCPLPRPHPYPPGPHPHPPGPLCHRAAGRGYSGVRARVCRGFPLSRWSNSFLQGECVDGTCKCYPGFSGPDCGIKACFPPCINGGRCDPSGSGCVIICSLPNTHNRVFQQLRLW